MTGTAIPVAVPASRGHLLSDIGVMTKRNLMHYRRRPQLIVFATIQPIMFFLLMAFVFGVRYPTPPTTSIFWPRGFSCKRCCSGPHKPPSAWQKI